MCGNPFKSIGKELGRAGDKMLKPFNSLIDSTGKAVEEPFRTGASAAKRAAKEQQAKADKAYDQQQARLAEERRAEQERKANIAKGKSELNRIFGGLGRLGDNQQKAYLDFARPQLQDQFGDARKQLTYALSNQGQLESSVAGDRFGRLERDYGLQKQQMADTARGYKTSAQSDIERQRQNLMGMLNSTADVNAVTQSANNQVRTMREMPTFSMLGPLFQNATAGLASRQQGINNRELTERASGVTYGGNPDAGSGRVLRR